MLQEIATVSSKRDRHRAGMFAALAGPQTSKGAGKLEKAKEKACKNGVANNSMKSKKSLENGKKPSKAAAKSDTKAGLGVIQPSF